MAGSTLGHLARVAADELLELTVVGSFTRIGPAARSCLFDWSAPEPGSLAGRVVLVTGATSGLGRAAATDLARAGATVWLLGRSAERTEAARDRIAAEVAGADLRVVVADLAHLTQVRDAAAAITAGTDRLDVLVHNAGAMAERLERTTDGIEVTAQTHVAAPFLLTAELLPLLRSTPDARVITVSSGGMYTHGLELDELDHPDPATFDGVAAYARAKRAQVVLGERWAAREPDVAFHVMHPGWADTPGVETSLPRFHRLMGPLLRTPEEGADTIVWLATAPSEQTPSGRFWLDRRPRWTVRLPGTRPSEAEAARLWDWCVERTGADVTPPTRVPEHPTEHSHTTLEEVER